MILGILTEIADTSSKVEKLALIESVRGTGCEEMFTKVVTYAYSQFFAFNVAKFKKAKEHTGVLQLKDCFEVLDKLHKREVSGKEAVALVEETHRKLSEDDAEVFARILKRDLRCGATSNTFNKVWPDLVYIHPYQRCSSFSTKNLSKIKKPCVSEIKMDGMYVDIIITPEAVVYRSRAGLELPFGCEERSKVLRSLCMESSGYVLMGEAVVLSPDRTTFLSRKEGNGYLNSDNIDVSRVNFVLWDYVPLVDFKAGYCNRPRDDRFKTVQFVCDAIELSKVANFVSPVEHKICQTEQDVIDHFLEAVERGEEGTVVKNLSAIWKDGTSTEQVKIKILAEGELEVVSVLEGEGRLAGMCGSLLCKSSCGQVLVGVAGLSDALRLEFFKNPSDIVGKIVTVRYNGVIYSESKKCHSLFLPRFVEIRNDKTEADSLERLIEQEKASVDAIKLA